MWLEIKKNLIKLSGAAARTGDLRRKEGKNSKK